MFTEDQTATLESLYDGLLKVTAISVESQIKEDERELAKFGLTAEKLIEKRLPFRSGTTIYFQHKMEALIESRKDFHWGMKEGISVPDFLNHQNGKLESLNSNLDQLPPVERTSTVRASFEGKMAGFIAVVSLLEEIG